ncbi:uncharacterized protein Z518_04417 [Rhinocladiella mackenziei CBS 650.93]|uniref:Uncharacterized protein n=1 Tax=Rhinocladiella mackenziei CBS 650.93 TaxID=1442369 RepID=A0A0D2ITF3_9EURO|nr:uncharacterized protein Z518_04417 [Rhinocladiella mackenziei CBS 650.93]KIX06441.1 hypothetical protein Z518_04417 [Rhinocladiella mackenziei CBS 650.93]
MPSIKRQASDSFSQPQALVKRQKSSSELNESRALTAGETDQNGTLTTSVLRTSALPAPIMELTGMIHF